MIYVVATIVVCIWIYNFLGGPLVETILLTLKAVFEEIGKWMPQLMRTNFFFYAVTSVLLLIFYLILHEHIPHINVILSTIAIMFFIVTHFQEVSSFVTAITQNFEPLHVALFIAAVCIYALLMHKFPAVMATLTGISILGVLVYCFIFHRETLLEALSVIIYFSIVFALHCLFAPEIVSYSSKNGAWYESDDGGINFHKRG